MVSIKDIARAARVSHSTVSRALRNSPLVNPETKALIHKIATQRGYTVSAVARSLVTRRTDTLGVVVTTIADPFAGEVVSGVEETALEHGYSVILSACHGDPAREMRAVQSLHERRVDGILVLASRIGAHYLPLLSELKVPIVLLNSHHPGEFVYSVRIDDLGGARMAVQHLIELGHERIAYIGDQSGFQSDADRLAGYRETLTEAGIKPLAGLATSTDASPAGGLSAMTELLNRRQPPTAVFCYNDRIALGAMRAIRDRGLRIPEDLSVVGFDDLFLSSFTNPPLTTIRQPKHDMGRLAGEILLGLLSGEKPESIVCSGELVVRCSTGGVGRKVRGAEGV